ncbi:MAG TPA: DUF6062 family protein [Bacillota bacterium]|nr:DUF6062 family protein [Bacillota bacterium]HPE38889.1 DUF6062 family protein [Bacillota bacterium]
MKEKIYMIPVNDAYHSDAACPLCALRAKVEANALDYYLGPSLMEPDTRKMTNTTGFCGEHLEKMFAREINRLGMGLMLHTHLMDVKTEIDPLWEKAAPASRSLMKGKDAEYKKRLTLLADAIDKRMGSCIICDKIDFTMDRYADVLLSMFTEDADFRAVFSEKKHCLPHTAYLLRAAAKYLNQNAAAEFVPALRASSQAGMGKMIADVEWFTLKFDYRNNDKPWGDSKDAVPRAIDLLSGKDEV